MNRSLFFALLVALAFSLTHGALAQGGSAGYYEAFVSARQVDAPLIGRLQAAGAQVVARYDGFVAARVPMSVTMSSLLAIDGVSHVSPAIPLVTCMDSVRYYSRVDAVQQGLGFEQPYTGNGVIVGVIDCGIDFNHINFMDGNGHSRVKAVYVPLDNSGTAPVVDGLMLPGSCYESADAIARLTTDESITTHGTMTAGIAAGSYRANGWHGMAPEADIVACGIPESELNDVRVACCVSYIADYARRAGKPCVINISLGTNMGPHDGTSLLNKVFNQVSGPGRVVVVSAGNDGGAPVRVHRATAGASDTVTVLLDGYRNGDYFSGAVSAWSKDNTPVQSRFVIVDVNNGGIVYESKNATATVGAKPIVVSSESDQDFSVYLTGSVQLSGAIDANGRYSASCQMDMEARSTDYAPGIQYITESSTEITVWSTQYAPINSYGFNWTERGSRAGSISDLATTDSVISVGSYNTKQYVPLRDGTLYYRLESQPQYLSYYSAYGPDENGIQRPDVCAPGSVVIASANRYDTEAPNIGYWQPSVYFNGVEYPYCPDLGTSMSAPAVAGAIALWMQANPQLSTQDVRNILNYTSYKDSYVSSGNQRWGSGKLNVAEGMRYVLRGGAKKGDINLDGAVNVSDISVLISILLDGTEDKGLFLRADVNGDGDVNVSDLNIIIEIILNS